MVQKALTLSSTNLVTISHAGKSCSIHVSSSDAPSSLGENIQDLVGVPLDPHDLNADRRVLRLVETLPRTVDTSRSTDTSSGKSIYIYMLFLLYTVHYLI